MIKRRLSLAWLVFVVVGVPMGCAEDDKVAPEPQRGSIQVDISEGRVELKVDGVLLKKPFPLEIKGDNLVTVKLNDTTSFSINSQRFFLSKDSNERVTVDIHGVNGSAKEVYESAIVHEKILKINNGARDRINKWYETAGKKVGFSHAETFSGGVDRPCAGLEIMNSFNDTKPYFLSISIFP